MEEYNLELMILGHEIWMEPMKKDNNNVSIGLLFGHNMRIDGIADKSRFLTTYFSPDEIQGEIDLVTAEDRHYLNFIPIKDGYYSVYADMGAVIYSINEDGYNQGPKYKFKGVTYSGAFHQMAKTIVPVGNVGEYPAKALHGILEIVPRTVLHTVGSKVELTIYYEDNPLPDTEIKAISGKEGKEMACITTDQNGVVTIPLSAPGKWMFLARHIDKAKKVSEEFDESVFISTLVLDVK